MAEYVKATLAELPANASVPVGSKGWVMTGDKIYEWDGDSWVLKSIGGAALVSANITGSDVPFPESWSTDFSFVGTVVALGTTSVITSYSKGTFVISGLGAETISVTGLIGAAQTLATAAIRVIDLNTGALVAASALPDGSYKLVDLAVHKLVFTKSAAVNSTTVTLTLKA